MNKNGWLMPVLVALLMGAVFYIGRLSARLEKAESGKVANSAVVSPTIAESPISVPNLKKMAQKVGLDSNEFGKCLDEGKFAKKVADDQQYGTSLDVSGTPSFFINGLMMVGALPTENFVEVIDAELKDRTGNKVLAKLTGETNVSRVDVKMGVGNKWGVDDAKVKIVEFTDYECPFCNRVVPTIDELKRKYEGKISIEVRNFPLSFHKDAKKAAEAAECAGSMGKFWEMHDAMFAAMAAAN